MTSSQLEILARLEETTTALLADMEAALPGLNKELLIVLNDFISSLDKTITGRVKATVENLKKVNAFRKVMDKSFIQGEYVDSVRQFIKGFDTTATIINEYFVSVVKEFQASKAVYQAVRQANIETTVSSMLGSGLDSALKDPVIKLLRQNVAGATDSKALQQLLKNEILGTPTTPPMLTRYVKQVTNDALYQFENNYLLSVANDLSLTKYFYQGTAIKDSRPFCVERTGKYFTREQVESWAGLSWSGKNKSTTKDSIFWLRGGFACRHMLIPVSDALFERQAKKT